MIDPWQELGVAPTANREAIRRAYAVRLKQIDPVKDGRAFERLRTAYEAILHGTLIQLASAATEPGLDSEHGETVAAICADLEAGRLEEAFALFERADAAHELPLGATHELGDAFLAQAVVANRFPRKTLLTIARRFGWDDATHPGRKLAPGLFVALDRRLAAETWYDELLRRANMPLRWWPPPAALVAQLLLRGPPRWRETLGLADWRLMLGGPYQQLRADLKRIDQHWVYIGDRFDANRIRWCRRRSFPGRITLIYILVIGMVVPADILLGVPTNPGQINFPLYVAVAILVALRLTHRRRSDP